MKKLSLISSAVASALFLTGCDKPQTTQPQIVAVGEVVATVNGKPISRASVEMLSDEVSQHRGGNKVSDDKIIEELIKRELLSQELAASDLMKDPKFAAKLENAQRMLMSQAMAEKLIETTTVNDADLKKEYDDRVGAMKNMEYKAKHILVETEQTAKDIITKLGAGEKFDALAKKLSKDPGSKDKGGELGWFSAEQMVPEFSQAVAGMKKGDTSKTPVKTQFGYHIIVLEDSREQTPPPFDTVKDQLKGVVQTKQLQKHIADLQAKAKIEKKAVEAKPAEPAKPADAAKPASAAPAAPAAPAPAPAK